MRGLFLPYGSQDAPGRAFTKVVWRDFLDPC